jgi:hypothetical protein
MDALVILAALYFVPALIALGRRHHNIVAIFAFNTLLGWSCAGLDWRLHLVPDGRHTTDTGNADWHARGATVGQHGSGRAGDRCVDYPGRGRDHTRGAALALVNVSGPCLRRA